MRWRMVLEVVGADGTRLVHEVGAGERSPAGETAAAKRVFAVHPRPASEPTEIQADPTRKPVPDWEAARKHAC